MVTETLSVPRDTAIATDKLYSHFKKLHSHQQVGKAQENILKDLKNNELNFMLLNNLDQPFTENGTKAAIKLSKSKKASGPDKMRSEMFKCGIHIRTNPVFNKIIKNFTENWTLSRYMVLRLN